MSFLDLIMVSSVGDVMLLKRITLQCKRDLVKAISEDCLLCDCVNEGLHEVHPYSSFVASHIAPSPISLSFRQLHHLHPSSLVLTSMDIMDSDLNEEYSQLKVVTKPPRSGPTSTKRAKKCASLEVKIQSKPISKFISILNQLFKIIPIHKIPCCIFLHFSRDQKMHRSIFAEGGIPDGTPLAYMSNGEICLRGCKKGCGILCFCCNQEISASQFEVHAGFGTRKKPYEHIFVSNGVSLHDYSSIFKLTGQHREIKNNDICEVCKEGEDLLLCDGCPRSFHEECTLAKTRTPLDKWFCEHCQRSMGPISNVVASGVYGINPLEFVNRCVRIIDNPNKHDQIACSLCRSYDFCADGFNDQTVIVCDQCELEFHIGCLREHCKDNLKELPHGSWFCSVECGRLNYVVKVLVAFGAQEVPSSLLGNITDLDLKWMIIHGKHASQNDKVLLVEAAKIFHDGFNPITDMETGMDFIDAMTYGKNIDASDFAGVHCAILKTGSKVITAGLFRVFGHEMVELPIVATSQAYQGKGCFKVFFTCFEKLLSYLKIKKLVVPAAEDAKAMWTNKFGFRKLTPLERSEYKQKQTSMVSFNGTCLLEKEVPEGKITFEDYPFFSLMMW